MKKLDIAQPQQSNISFAELVEIAYQLGIARVGASSLDYYRSSDGQIFCQTRNSRDGILVTVSGSYDYFPEPPANIGL